MEEHDCPKCGYPMEECYIRAYRIEQTFYMCPMCKHVFAPEDLL